MLNILIIGKYYPPFFGGIENYTAYVAEAAAQHHRVTVLAANHEPGPSVRETINGVNVVRRRVYATLASQPITGDPLRGLKLNEFDVVHFHGPNPWANLFLLPRLLTKSLPPVVVTHNMDMFGRPLLRFVARFLYRPLLTRAATVIVHSLKNVPGSRDLPPKLACTEVFLGVRTEQFQPSQGNRTRGKELRRAHCGDAATVLFLGRHARYKGIEVLLSALVELKEVHALIAGEGPLTPEMKTRAAQLGVAERAHFLGSVSESVKLDLFCAADIFVMPSTERTEVFGLSQAEAMAAGLPVVTTDLPTGVTDVAIRDETALLAIPGDPASLATQIRRMLSEKSLGARLARNARQHVRENFDQTTAANRTRRVLERAAGVTTP